MPDDPQTYNAATGAPIDELLTTLDTRLTTIGDSLSDLQAFPPAREPNESLATSPRQRMAVARREILRWLAQPHVLQTARPQFEALLLEIAEHAEEWLTSAQVLGWPIGVAQRSTCRGIAPRRYGDPPATGSANGPSRQPATARPATRPACR